VLRRLSFPARRARGVVASTRTRLEGGGPISTRTNGEHVRAPEGAKGPLQAADERL